jgi:hypothetical protein
VSGVKAGGQPQAIPTSLQQRRADSTFPVAVWAGWIETEQPEMSMDCFRTPQDILTLCRRINARISWLRSSSFRRDFHPHHCRKASSCHNRLAKIASRQKSTLHQSLHADRQAYYFHADLILATHGCVFTTRMI